MNADGPLDQHWGPSLLLAPGLDLGSLVWPIGARTLQHDARIVPAER